MSKLFYVGGSPEPTFDNWVLKAESLSGLWNYTQVFWNVFLTFFSKSKKTWLRFFWVAAQVFLGHCFPCFTLASCYVRCVFFWIWGLNDTSLFPPGLLPQQNYDCSEVMREYYQNCFILQMWYLLNGQLTKTVHTSPVGPQVCLFYVFLGRMIFLNVCVCFILPWTVESFPLMFWRWRNKLKWAPFEFFAPSPLLRVRSWLHPFKGHCEQKAMRNEVDIYVAGHPLLNRRCTRLPGCFHFPECKQLLKARYSLIEMKEPLHYNQSVSASRILIVILNSLYFIEIFPHAAAGAHLCLVLWTHDLSYGQYTESTVSCCPVAGMSQKSKWRLRSFRVANCVIVNVILYAFYEWTK